MRRTSKPPLRAPLQLKTFGCPPPPGQMKKLLKSTKFPEHFEIKVDMKKVNIDVMIPWITEQVSTYLGFEDEVVIGYIEVHF